MDKNQKVSLGCGTLILIALIVMIFSNASTDDVQKEVNELRSEVRELNSKVEQLESKIDKLTQTLEQKNR
jgi:outer membrane murein-binding lipoprotein Lpp